jgi:hypothetical protein
MMTDQDMLRVVAEAAVALDDAKERIAQLEAELEDAERRIQFLERIL